MITLTINPETSPLSYTLDKEEIIIGRKKDSSDFVDVNIEDLSLEPVHLKIVKQGERFFIVNQANDPFVSLNGSPFGKRALKHLDRLQIGKTTILIEFDRRLPLEEKKNKELSLLEETPHLGEEKLDEAENKTFILEANPLFIQSTKEEKTPLEEPSWKLENEALDIEALVKEVEEMEWEDQYPFSEEASLPLESKAFVEERKIETINHPTPFINGQNLEESPIEGRFSPSLSEEEKEENLSVPFRNEVIKEAHADYYLKAFEEENEEWVKEGEKNKKKFAETWSFPWKGRTWALLFLALFFLSALVSSLFYLNMSGKNEEEELKAAEGVADVSMALLYAQINHIKSHKHNWSNPELIKNQLNNVFNHDYPALAAIDAHGHFLNTPYILRIYTSNDFSHFIVIAQAAPSLLGWLIPKTSILIDSKTMEMRKLTDLKGINRLLAQPNSLEGPISNEISHLIKQEGELLPLASLARKRKDKDFSPPKALALVRPGAENFVYNAPRYTQLGETMMNKALSLINNPGNAHEIARLRQEIGVISRLPAVVFYSSLGMEHAMQAQKALSTLIPEANFLAAYLTFNTQGTLIGSRLLLDEARMHSPFYREENGEGKEELASSFSHMEEVALEDMNQTVKRIYEEIDPYHPLLLQLASIAAERSKTLQRITEEMISLLDQNRRMEMDEFPVKFQDLFRQYETIHAEEEEKTAQKIREKEWEYKEMPLSLFLSYVKAAGLERYMKAYFSESLAEEDSLKEKTENEEREQNIALAKNFKELNESLSFLEEKSPLAFSASSSAEGAQKRIQTLVRRKLDQFLLNPSERLSLSSLTDDDRERLARVLRNPYLTEEGDIPFYLNQFDSLRAFLTEEQAYFRRMAEN